MTQMNSWRWRANEQRIGHILFLESYEFALNSTQSCIASETRGTYLGKSGVEVAVFPKGNDTPLCRLDVLKPENTMSTRY